MVAFLQYLQPFCTYLLDMRQEGSTKTCAMLALLLAVHCTTQPSATKPAAEPNKEKHSMTTSEVAAGYRRATGPFEVTMVPPQPSHDTVDEVALGRMTINKVLHGDLEATSVVEMLTAMTGVKGSGGYVAIERVTGTLQGRRGTFVMQHSGTMTRGEQQLVVSIVPDSGTGELKGIDGSMAINIVDGKHSYVLNYRLEGGPQAK